ncbi:MAG TPA: alpha/beta fold hydrolase, partial [Vicinamibacterales bacterium]
MTKHNRRDFMRDTAVVTAGAMTAPSLLTTLTALAPSVSAAQAAAAPAPLDVAEWSFFWVGVERAELAKGPVVNGKQMYVEYQIPTQVRHPYPIVLVHGGGGQGLDWLLTPDGRPGWATLLLQEGYKVYIVDRPGHGRSPYHPDLQGPFPAQHQTLESISGLFTPQRAKGRNNAYAELHNQWPGTGAVDAPELAQLVASQGGSFVANPVITQTVWRERGAMLLDKIGPAIIMTHSAGGPFGYLVAEVRPQLVKGIIVIEGAGAPFAGQNRWGLSAIPVTYDPPVSDPSQLKTKQVPSPEPGVGPYLLQEEPARKLKNLKGIPIVIFTAEGSFASPGNPGAVAFLKQAGCAAEELRLAAHGVHGNGHLMMGEKNNREALQPILDWIDKSVSTKNAPSTARKPRADGDSTAMRLAERGHFWVGIERKKMPYGTILAGPMYVQYLTPAQVRHPYPVVLVHGGGGQGTHYMGLGDGQSGWMHYFVQEGYKVYVVDRPGHGRAVYHPDSLGPITPVLTYDTVTGDFMRGANNPNRKWPGTGDVGDPRVDQFQAGQNSAPQDGEMAQRLWATRGAEMMDKIGPAVIVTHSAGGPFGWLVADQRPALVKGVVCVEGAGAPFAGPSRWGLTSVPLAFDPPVSDPAQLATRDVTPPAGSATPPYKLQTDPARKLKNLQGIPIAIVTAEASGRAAAPPVEFLKQAGCSAEDVQLKDRGILGNGHFMMLETNRRQV